MKFISLFRLVRKGVYRLINSKESLIFQKGKIRTLLLFDDTLPAYYSQKKSKFNILCGL